MRASVCIYVLLVSVWSRMLLLLHTVCVSSCMVMSTTYLSGSHVQDAASGQCLLPEDAFPWLFLRAHTCMLSPLSVCSLTFGTVKIEDTAGGEDASGLELCRLTGRRTFPSELLKIQTVIKKWIFEYLFAVTVFLGFKYFLLGGEVPFKCISLCYMCHFNITHFFYIKTFR